MSSFAPDPETRTVTSVDGTPVRELKPSVHWGNSWAIKLKGKEARQKAYRALCDWIGQGKSFKSFTYRDGKVSITGEGIEEMARRHPEEFDPALREIAHAESYKVWEKIVSDSATGNNPQANPASINMVMRNKFGWDRRDQGANAEVDREKFKFIADFFEQSFRKAKDKGN